MTIIKVIVIEEKVVLIMVANSSGQRVVQEPNDRLLG